MEQVIYFQKNERTKKGLLKMKNLRAGMKPLLGEWKIGLCHGGQTQQLGAVAPTSGCIIWTTVVPERAENGGEK